MYYREHIAAYGRNQIFSHEDTRRDTKNKTETVKQNNIWMIEKGLQEGEMLYELCDEETGEPLAILDLAWPNGIQEGFSNPAALLINEGREIEEIVNRAGYLYFTTVEAFKDYVKRDILNEEST